MIYFAYTDNGQFDGFYNTEINEVIPEKKLCISVELWQELLKSKYRVNLEIVSDYIDKECTLQEMEKLFIEDVRKEKEQLQLTDIQRLGQKISDLEIQQLMAQQMALMPR